MKAQSIVPPHNNRLVSKIWFVRYSVKNVEKHAKIAKNSAVFVAWLGMLEIIFCNIYSLVDIKWCDHKAPI